MKNNIFKAIYSCGGGLQYPSAGLLYGPNTTNTGTALVDSKGVSASFVDSNCLTFDGVDDRVGLSRKIGYFDDTTNPWTVDILAYHLDNALSEAYISNYGYEVSGFYLAKSATSGKLIFMMRKTAATDSLNFSRTNAIPTTQRVKIRITYDGSKKDSGCKLYFNGVEQVTKDTTVNTLNSNFINTSSLTTTIGCIQSASTPTYSLFLKGSLGYIRACSSVLTGTSSPINRDILDLNFAEGNDSILYEARDKQKEYGTLVNFGLPLAWTARKQSINHYNIEKGFTTSLKGNKTNSTCIVTDKLKNYGTGNFYMVCEFDCTSLVSTALEILFGNFIALGESRLWCYIGTTNVFSAGFSIGATLYQITTTKTIEVGKHYVIEVNVNRAGLMSLYVNGILRGSVNVSAASGAALVCARDFKIGYGLASGGTNNTWSNQAISRVSLGTGLLPLGNGSFSYTPDLANFIPVPNSNKFHDLTTGTEYTYTNARVNTFPAIITGNNNPAGNRHNGAETKLDFTNGGINTLIPVTYNAVTYNSVLTNPFFYRKTKKTTLTKKNDRYLIYNATQVDPALTKINTYINNISTTNIEYTYPLMEEIFNTAYMNNSFVGANGTRNEFAYYEFTYDGEYIEITMQCHTLNATYIGAHNISIYVNDVFYTSLFTKTAGAYPYRIKLPAGTKNVKVVDGGQMTPFALDAVTLPTDTYITSILAETGKHTVITSKTVTNKIVWLADSIGSGHHCWNNTTEAFTRLFYQNDGFDIAYVGGSSERLSFLASTITQRNLLHTYINSFLSNVSGRKIVVFQVCTNDYGAGVTKAQFKAYADFVIAKLITDHPTVEIYLVEAFLRSGETSLLQDLRDAYSELAVTYSGNCTYIPAKGFITLADCYDGLHPTDSRVHLSIYNQMRPYINP